MTPDRTRLLADAVAFADRMRGTHRKLEGLFAAWAGNSAPRAAAKERA